MSGAETSPDVCYRHPKRASWVLCQRCGRTICPECQILTPGGVRCPDCVRETGGSVQWRGAEASAAPRPAKAARPRAERPRSGWQGQLLEMLRPGSATPMASWTIIGLVVLLWIVSLVFQGTPFVFLVAHPNFPLELWRYVTAPISYIPLLHFSTVFGLLLSVVFFLLISPASERMLGLRRYVVIVLAAGVVGSAGMVLSGNLGFGLSGVLFGLFGAYLVSMWSVPPARNQVLIMIGVNALISILLGGYALPQIVGGLIAGAGAAFLLRHFDARSNARTRTPYLIIAAVVGGFVALTVIRQLALVAMPA